MANILNVPIPTKEKGQRSIDVSDLFLTRILAPWSRPATLPAYMWRQWVLNQSVAIVCRETLIANLLALDWKITPVNSKYKEELEPTIRYYTKLFKNGGNYPGLGLDYAGLIEWVSGDLLDLPFGGAAEIGRKGNAENGRVEWIRPLDAGTLLPTMNQDFPIVQYYPTYSNEVVTFREWEISRVFISPHSFLLREGWGMAPPEKVYFALDLLNKGDKYYANLLLDIPTAGILDLGDMEKSAAEEWVTAFKTFMADSSQAFRVPVLYEHNNKIEYIPFGKVPNDIMFNQITSKYAALVAAAYGMSLSDIGLQTTTASGETLAGSIRQERRTRKTGFARCKAKMKFFFDHILPDTLEFNFIDYDDELNVALGRARLASFTAFGMMQDKGVFSPQEIRSQIIQEGLVSISLPDEIPPDAKPLTPSSERTVRYVGEKNNDKPTNKEPELLGGNPKAPSSGGEGEKTKSFVIKSKPKNFKSTIEHLVMEVAPIIRDTVLSYGEDDFNIVRSMISETLFDDVDTLELQSAIEGIMGSKSLIDVKFDGIEEEFRSMLDGGYSDVNLQPYINQLESNVKKSINGFIGRTAVYLLNDVLFDNGMFADSEEVPYNLMVKQVQDRIEKSLQDFISIHINDEALKILNKIRLEN